MEEKMILNKIVLLLTLINSGLVYSQRTYPVLIYGMCKVEGGVSKIESREAAKLDAIRQAIEKGGIHIKAETTVRNYQVIKDEIIAKSQGILLPGFEILDIGVFGEYYLVALNGNVSSDKLETKYKSPEDTFTEVINSDPALKRLKEAYFDNGLFQKTRQLLNKIIETKRYDLCISAHFLIFYWGLYNDAVKEFDDFNKIYPNNPLLEPSKECIVKKAGKVFAALNSIHQSEGINTRGNKNSVEANQLFGENNNEAKKEILQILKKFHK
jgi:hypothetical protein